MLKVDVIKYFGSVRKVAKFLDLSTQAVHQWPEKVPAAQAYKLQVLTEGKLRVE